MAVLVHTRSFILKKNKNRSPGWERFYLGWGYIMTISTHNQHRPRQHLARPNKARRPHRIRTEDIHQHGLDVESWHSPKRGCGPLNRRQPPWVENKVNTFFSAFNKSSDLPRHSLNLQIRRDHAGAQRCSTSWFLTQNPWKNKTHGKAWSQNDSSVMSHSEIVFSTLTMWDTNVSVTCQLWIWLA